jgi:hypothetical protein
VASSVFASYFVLGSVARSSVLISRIWTRTALRVSTFSRVQAPCLKLPLRSPCGPPDPLAPPCIRQRDRPVTAAYRGDRLRVRAPHRRAWASSMQDSASFIPAMWSPAKSALGQADELAILNLRTQSAARTHLALLGPCDRPSWHHGLRSHCGLHAVYPVEAYQPCGFLATLSAEKCGSW